MAYSLKCHCPQEDCTLNTLSPSLPRLLFIPHKQPRQWSPLGSHRPTLHSAVNHLFTSLSPSTSWDLPASEASRIGPSIQKVDWGHSFAPATKGNRYSLHRLVDLEDQLGQFIFQMSREYVTQSHGAWSPIQIFRLSLVPQTFYKGLLCFRRCGRCWG